MGADAMSECRAQILASMAESPMPLKIGVMGGATRVCALRFDAEPAAYLTGHSLSAPVPGVNS
jgi:hypothetical protein